MEIGVGLMKRLTVWSGRDWLREIVMIKRSWTLLRLYDLQEDKWRVLCEVNMMQPDGGTEDKQQFYKND